MPDKIACIVLAAGKGERMGSDLPKVLHRVGNEALIQRTIKILKNSKFTQVIIVVNKQNHKAISDTLGNEYQYAVQEDALGTANAVKSGLSLINSEIKTVAVFYGDDTAFYKPQTIKNVLNLHTAKKPKITFITVIKDNPQGLGRIIRENGKLK